MKNLIAKLVKLLVRYCEYKKQLYYITGEASSKEDIYLVRYIVFKSKLFSIYIHRFMRSDSSDPHDHPWNFFTYVVENGYTEYFYDINKPVRDSKNYHSFWTLKINNRPAGSFAFRRATDIHRVVVDKRRKIKDINKAPLTICLMLNRKRHWGFWPLKDKGSKFIDWRTYLKIKPNDPRIEGSE